MAMLLSGVEVEGLADIDELSLETDEMLYFVDSFQALYLMGER